jgi:hypothetical protein
MTAIEPDRGRRQGGRQKYKLPGPLTGGFKSDWTGRPATMAGGGRRWRGGASITGADGEY